MERIFTILCALAIVMAGSATALTAEPEAGQNASYYPVSVEEYTYGDFDELRINKTYQLSLSDDPSLIPTEDFVRYGRRYYLLDMTRKDGVGVDIQTYTETVTKPSDTNSLESILQRLDAEMEVTTDGYATKTSTLSASRSYPNLSEADVSLIPKTVEDRGKTLTLGDVKWSESMDVDGEGSPVTRYTASYTGEVSKANCAVVTYTAIFGSEKAPEDYLFGQPTSDDTIYEWENPNVDRSKNAALIAPGFGSPTSYLPGSGEYLTPNLVPNALPGGLVNQVGSAALKKGASHFTNTSIWDGNVCFVWHN